MTSSKKWLYSNYTKIDSVVRDKFPFEKPRPYQLETISEIKEAIENGYKYIILEAGTGTGKSLIAATLASIYDSSYIFTVTKQLQDQYLNDFAHLGFKVVKGRGNFPCIKYLEEGIEHNCDEGRCVIEGYSCEFALKNKSKKNNNPTVCHYELQKWHALNSKVVISNYHYLFLELNYNKTFKKRKLMIFDEAHNLENAVMSQLKLEFTRKELKDNVKINLSKEALKLLKEGDYHYWIRFIEIIRDKYLTEYKRIKKIKHKKGIKERIQFIKRRIEDCDRFIIQIKRDPSKWIFDYDSRYKVAEFKPIKVENYAENTLFKYGDICLFMSATILDYELFAKWLGINKDEIYAIRRKSPFDVSRNPIITYEGFEMSYNSLSYVAPITVNTIKNILEKHKNEKGVIHTVSYQCKNYLMKKLNDKRLIDHNAKNRAQQFEKFKNSDKPLVFISPSINEGVDLPGDQCRFQIIYKIPYPNLSDKQTNKRKDVDEEWYSYRTSLSLVQTYGRGMRYERDFCKTYFIDSRLKKYVYRDEMTYNFLPDFFKEAIDIIPAKISNEDKIYNPIEITRPKSKPSIDNPPIDFSIFDNSTLDTHSNNHMNEYSKEYFYQLADEIINTPGFISDRSLSKHKDSDFIEFTNHELVNKKFDLIIKGKNLEKDNPKKAISFYDDLKKNEYFTYDYYPYRRQCILFKNKIKDYKKDWQTIIELFSNEIYCNKHQYIWLNNKILELMDKLKLSNEEVSNIGNLLSNYLENELKYKELQESNPIPIAERIFKDENGLRILSQQKYDCMQEVYRKKEICEGYMRREDYNNAIKYAVDLLSDDFLYFKYYSYKKLGLIFEKMNDYDKFKEIYEKYSKTSL